MASLTHTNNRALIQFRDPADRFKRVSLSVSGVNRRTAERMVAKAGLTQWPRLFQNLRASLQTDLAERLPLHVVCGWLGNTDRVAVRHYLSVTDDHFAQAAGIVLQKGLRQAPAQGGSTRKDHQKTTEMLDVNEVEYPRQESGYPSVSREFLQNRHLALHGLLYDRRMVARRRGLARAFARAMRNAVAAGGAK